MPYSRRSFCKSGLTLIGGASLLSGLPLSMACSRNAASDTLRVALIGCRNMGYSNLQVFATQPDVKIVGLCDIDESILNQRAADLEKLAFDREIPNFRKPELYKDFRKVLDSKEVDAVIIATPDHWHALITIMACQAGKDVYVEKPMANSIVEAEMMYNAGNKYDKVIQVGQWQRSGPHWMEVKDYVQSGQLGAIDHIDVWLYGGNEVPVLPDEPVPAGVNYDLWLGPAQNRPFNRNRFHYNFRWFWDYAGGKMTDWGVHLLDMALMSMKVKNPLSITGQGGKFVFPDDAMETPDTLSVDYQFRDFRINWKNDFGLKSREDGLSHGLVFYGENGKLIASRQGWEVKPESAHGGTAIEAVDFKPSGGKDLQLHIRNFIDAVKERNRNTHCSVEIGRDVARVAHMGNISYRTQETIHWNPETLNFAEAKANMLLEPAYRKPWQLPRL